MSATSSQKLMWLRCPECHGKTRIRVSPSTVLLEFPLFCPKCRQSFCISVVQKNMIYRREPNT